MKDELPFRFGAAWRRSASRADLVLFGAVLGLENGLVGYEEIAVVAGDMIVVVAVARIGHVEGVVVPEVESVQASVYAAGPVSGFEHVSGLGSASGNVVVGAVSVVASASASAAVLGLEVWEPGEGAESVVVEVPAGLAVKLAALLAALLPSGLRV